MSRMLIVFCLLCFCVVLIRAEGAQLPSRDSEEPKELLQEAQLADARSSGSSSFRLRAKFSVEHAGQMTPDGNYLLLWATPTKWREEISTSDFSQVRLGGEGGIWEARKPSYQSLRVWQLIQALAFNSRFTPWHDETLGAIKLRKKNGTLLRCVKSYIRGNLLRELCFDNSLPSLILEQNAFSGRAYEFSDYATLGNKKFPRHIIVHDSKQLAVDFSVEDLQAVTLEASSFEKPSEAQWRVWCSNPEPINRLTQTFFVKAPPTARNMTFYGRIGTDGKWHDLVPLESGGATLDAVVMNQLEGERWKPATCGDVPVMDDRVFTILPNKLN